MGSISFCWAMFFHSAPNGVHFFLLLITILLLLFFVLGRFSPNLTSHITILLTFLPW
jgi:hypothetical protein